MSTQQEVGERGRDYRWVVRKRTSVIVTCVALAVGVALPLSLWQDERYEATARVLLQPAEAERAFDSLEGGGR